MTCLYCNKTKLLAKGLCSRHYSLQRAGLPMDTPPRKKAIVHKHHPIYLAWCNMKTRCHNPKSTQYKWYGARGISYDPEWEVFENFYNDMEPSWHSGLMLDREDNNADYSFENCRWVTPTVSANNRRVRGTC